MAETPRLRLRLAAAALLLGLAPAGASAEGVHPGAERFLRTCSACHGEKGDGRSRASATLKTPPRDFTTEEARTNLSREYMIAIVRDGRPHTAMVGRATRLAQPEIEGVVDFIRTAFMPPEPGSRLAQGRATYLKSCTSCHGDRGQGSAARGSRPASPPIAAARAAPGLTPEGMVGALQRESHVPGAPDSRLGMTEGEARAVVDYVRTTFIEVAAGTRSTGARRAE